MQYFFTFQTMNPFQVLNISVGSSDEKMKAVFRMKISTSYRHERATYALAYDMICSRDPTKYTRDGFTFAVKKRDLFFYAITGNYESFVHEMKRNPYLLNRKDECGRTLLYLAARNGYYDICNFLLRSGCKIDETQKDGSTALHGASFYGHETIVRLLLEYGADANIRNRFGHEPYDEASSRIINDYIVSKAHDKINEILNQLKHNGLVKNFVLIKHHNEVIAKKILRNLESHAEYSTSYYTNQWTLAWHVTKYEHLYSIMKYGLHAAGTLVSPGYRLAPQKNHIGLNKRVGSYDNWANAIFVSPSVFYAAHAVYAERKFSDKKQWCVVVETRVRPGSFTRHKHTLLKRDELPGEPTNVEYRVEVKSDDDFIFRVESERNVLVTAVVFINVNFLENIDEYYQGQIFANSEAERALFQ